MKISAKSEEVGNETIYSVRNLIGQEEAALSVFARSLVEALRVERACRKPLLVSVGVAKSQLEPANFEPLFRASQRAIVDFYSSN